MKKLLSILASIGIIASGGSSIMAMSRDTNINKPEINNLDSNNSRFEKVNQTTMNYLKTIEVPKTADVALNGFTSVTIQNFNDLTNLHVESIDTETVKVQLIDDLVRINGVKVGNTVIKVSADDAGDAFISVTVHALKNIDVDENAETYVTKATNLQIRNASELIEIYAQSNNQEVATASIVNNQVEIVGISKGTAQVTVSALNAVKNSMITVTINELGTIEIDRDNASIIVNQSTNFKINNFQDLEDVQVKSENLEVARTWISNNIIVVQGMSIGSTEIIVSAFNAQSKIISVTVSDLMTIQVDKETVNIYADGSEEVKITNFLDLKEVDVKSNDSSIAKAIVDNQGIITVQGVNAGITTISITAQDAYTKEISVTINELGKVIVDKETVEIYGWEPEIVNIANYSDLVNIKIQSTDEKVAKVLDYETGMIAIMRVGGSIGDQTTIEITADHTVKTTIPVLIKAQISLSEAINTLALDSQEESQIIDEVIRRNSNSGLKKEDIKIKEGSFKAPISEELKWGEVIIESNTPKYTDEINLLLAPQMLNDPKIEDLMTKIKNGKDLEERKPYWEEYFKYKGVIFFKELMPKNPWNFKKDDFEFDENGNQQIKPEAFNLITDYLDAMVQRLLQQDFRNYQVTPDHQKFNYNPTSYATLVTGDFAAVHFAGHYNFLFSDNSHLRVDFEGDIEGPISA